MPGSPKPRDHAIRIRVRAAERKSWEAAARREDMSVSDWARRILNAAAESR